MKQIFTILFTIGCIIYALPTQAQGIHQMWGTTSMGGKDDNGTFFSTRFDGTGQTNYNYFTASNSGRAWDFNQPVAYNGKFYSGLTYGGVNDDGIISEYNPATNSYITGANFYDAGLKGIRGALVAANSKLYGISVNNNANSVLFEYNPANASIAIKHEFIPATGASTGNEPTAYNGKLYGSTSHGGNNNFGVIYEYDPAAEIYTIKHHFTEALKGGSTALCIYAGLLWGVASGEKIFSFNPATNAVQFKQEINQLGPIQTYGRMAVLNNKLYGVSNEGGIHDDGFIFEYDPTLNSVQIEFSFTPATAQRRLYLLVYNGLLYGASMSGTPSLQGALFSYNTVSNVYTSLKEFSLTEGSGVGRLMLYNNKMYGWLLNGGYDSGKTNLFEFNPANNGFELKIKLGGDELYDPNGQLMYYKHKLYGITETGGPGNAGGIYAFDLQTKTFEVKVPMSQINGKAFDQGGFLLYNDVFYGVTYSGGATGYGTLFRYDPNSNEYTKIFDFGGTAGQNPMGQLVVWNNRIFGTCAYGSSSDKGSIFEFNPFNNTVVTRAAFSGTTGANPLTGLTVFHNRIFGVTRMGGLHDDGVLFEYLPLPNGMQKLHDFNFNTSGAEPVARLSGYDNKLWGITALSNAGSFAGIIFQYDLAQGTFQNRLQLSPENGRLALGGMTMLNHKFYGITTQGGTSDAGVVFEYDPALNNYTAKTHFTPANGKAARRTDLATAPAPAAPGTANSCNNANFVNIVAANANQWVAFTDAQGRAVAEINANGNILGSTELRFYVNGNATRQSGEGIYYLDRNITIRAANAPVTPVSVRLYIRKTEFESLKATAGSGVTQPTDLVIYQNNDFCAAQMSTTALPLPTVKSDWGFDYVYSAEVTSLASFYFAKLSGALPVKILSFNGIVEEQTNKLQWKATCTNDVDFIVERSTDAIHFDSIGVANATINNCNLPFELNDNAPAAKSYYRLKLKENNGNISYSNIIVLERKNAKQLSLSVYPNPVTGKQVNINVISPVQQNIPLHLSDLSGRRIWNGMLKVNEAVNTVPVNLPQLAAGMYYLQYNNAGKMETIKLIKQ